MLKTLDQLIEQHSAAREKAAFYACLNQYRTITAGNRAYHHNPRNEEFAADFYLIARRTLSLIEFAVFERRILLSRPDTLGLTREELRTTKERIAAKLGAKFIDLKPFPLFPVRDYFENRRPHGSAESEMRGAADLKTLLRHLGNV